MSEQKIIESWAAAVRIAYYYAKGERLAELRGEHRYKRFDDRGLHPWSLTWGHIFAMQDLLPALSALEADPVLMRREAHNDAARAFAEEIIEKGGL